jgi:hypothetical protein
MSSAEAPTPTTPDAILALIDGGRFDEARSALAGLPAGALSAASTALLKLRLGLREGSLPGDIVMQRLIQLMRKDPELPGARELYTLASEASFDGGESSHSHSHPPPPVRRDD